jgi:hypothetical protein
LETLQLDYFTHELEHYYFVDIAGMALWSDGKIENNEAYFYILLLTLFQFQMPL